MWGGQQLQCILAWTFGMKERSLRWPRVGSLLQRGVSVTVVWTSLALPSRIVTRPLPPSVHAPGSDAGSMHGRFCVTPVPVIKSNKIGTRH